MNTAHPQGERPMPLRPSTMSSAPFWMMLRRVAVFASLVDLLYLVVFLLLGMPIIAFANLVSMGMYALAYFLLGRRKNRPAVMLMWAEVLAHTSVCTVLIGWELGAHYFLLVFLPAVAVSRTPGKAIAALAFLLFFYLGLDAATVLIAPAYPMSANTLLAMRWLSITIAFSMFTYLGRYYVRRVAEAEKRLQKANLDLEAALQDLSLSKDTVRRTELLRIRQSERERIAGDLHDTLLQGVYGLLLKVQSAANRLPPNAKERCMLEEAVDRADRLASETRDRVAGLRGSGPQFETLQQAIEATIAEFVNEGPVRFQLSVEGQPVEFSVEVQDELYCIAREAMRNCIDHAGAQQVDIGLLFAGSGFQMRIRDDGRGIDSQAAAVNRWGIRGMLDRAKRIGGELQISSNTSGTTVEVSIPAA